MKTETVIEPETDTCMGYEEQETETNEAARRNASSKTPSGDYYAELVKDIERQKCLS